MEKEPLGVPFAFEEAADGTWRCRHCGTTGNTAKFCTECGMPKEG